MKKLLILTCAAGMTILGASAADYHWTGAAGNRLWSDPGNWETSAGAAVESVDAANPHTYNFGTRSGTNVGWENGLVVTQDVNVVIGSAMAVNPADGNFITLEIVSAPGCKMSMAGDPTEIYCQQNSQLKLTVDMSDDNSGKNIFKHNSGRLVWNLKAANKNTRNLYVRAGTVVLGGQNATGVSPNLRVQMATASTQGNTARFENELDGGVLQALNVGALDAGANNISRVYLKDNTLNVGGESVSSSTNLMPFAIFGKGGTLALRNERRFHLRGLPMDGTLAVDRADAYVVTPNTAIRWLFDDASDPTRDVVGSGYRMLAPNGMPEVVTDATRGCVLSISGGKYFKGPDANAGLDGLLLQTTNNPYTVAFWFKPAASCDNVGKIFYWGSADSYKSAGLRLNNDTAKGLMFTLWGDNRTLTTSANPRNGNWHHFAVVYNGYGFCSIYYDGVLVDQFTTPSSYNPPNKNFYIGSVYGGWASNGANPYTGLLDDFLIGSYALTAEEIAAIKDNGLAAAIPASSVEARSAGEVAFAKIGASAKTLSGNALAGGVTMLADGATLTVGAEVGTAETEFKGKISGGNTTLVKEGTNYALTISGPATAVTNVVVKEGTLELRRQTARAGLVAYYSFDDDVIGADSSSAGFVLSKAGNGTVSQTAAGVSGKALRFGGSAYLKSSDDLHAMFPTGNDSYTVSMWIKPTAEAYSGNRPLYCWGVDSSNPGYTSSFMRLNGGNSGGGVMFTHWGDNYEAKAGNLADGRWHHVVAVYDGTTRVKTVYVDGTAYVASANGRNAAVDGKTSLYVGSRSNSTSTTYSGDMDEFMVIAGAWTADEVANEYAHKAPALVAAETLLPTPVAHWTFDDDEAPGADLSGNALNLTMNGTVSLESGDAICGKAARFSSTSGYFKLDTFPSVIPTSSNAFTVVVRYRPDTTQASSYYPGIVMWGDTGGWNSGKLVKISLDHDAFNSIRSTVAGSIFTPEGLYRTDMGTDRSRWVTAAFTYSLNKYTTKLYVDGEFVYRNEYSPSNISAQDFSIGSNYAGNQHFYGLIDDVQIFDKTLSANHIRLIAERLEAAKGGVAASTASVLAANPDVTVADGAMLKVSSEESVSSLSGAGTVDVTPLGSLAVAKFDGFFGAVTGCGAFGIADNAAIEFGDGSTPVIDAAGTVALGANVTVNATFTEGKHDLIRAASFAGLKNLATWRAVLPGGREAILAVSRDGKSIVMKVQKGFVLSIQ